LAAELGRRMPVAPENIRVQVRQPYALANQNGIRTSSDWSAALSELNRLKTLENSTSHYYGLAIPRPSGGGFPGGERSTAGMGYLDSTVGMGLAPPSDSWKSIAVHEFGHNYGLGHAPCGQPATVDSAYPYPEGRLGPQALFDSVEDKLLPSSGTDVMGYCNGVWFSDFNVQRLQARLETLYKPLPKVASTAALDGGGAPTEAPSLPNQPMLMVSGSMNRQGEVSLQPLHLATGLTPTAPVPFGTTREVAVLRVHGAAGQSPAELLFSPLAVDPSDEHRFFTLVVPAPSDIARVEVLRQGIALPQRMAQASQRVTTTAEALAEALPSALSADLRQTAEHLEVTWTTAPGLTVTVAYLHAQGERTVMALEAGSGTLHLPLATLPVGGTFEVNLTQGQRARMVRVKRL
jgi:hypothetical protein